VNEVVRQILPIVPQIVGMLQSPQQPPYAAMQGGPGLGNSEVSANSASAILPQTWGTQFGAPQFQSAFGAPLAFGQQRQLTQQDVAEHHPPAVGIIPQVIGNLQAYSQQRMI